MKISVNIASYRRPKVDTLKILPNACLWIEKEELPEYQKNNKDADLRLLPAGMRGIPTVKNYILKQQMPGNDVICFIDDDVSAIHYWEKTKKKELDGEDSIMEFIEKYSIIAKELEVFYWGINCSQDPQVYREYSPFSLTSYISSSFSCFLVGNQIAYDERLPLKEDYDMTIAQCNRYRKVLRVNKFFMSIKQSENVGGCASIRTIDREKSQFDLLQKKWGKQIVKLDEAKRSHNLKKKKILFDYNPIIHIPINGI